MAGPTYFWEPPFRLSRIEVSICRVMWCWRTDRAPRSFSSSDGCWSAFTVSQLGFVVGVQDFIRKNPHAQERKISPKSKFWGRISGGHPRGYPGGRPGAKTSVKPSKSWKNKHLGADVHDPKARMWMTPGGFKKTSVRKTSGWIFVPYTPIKIKLALPPPLSKKPQTPPPAKKEDFYGHGGFPAERTKKCQAPIK